MELGLGWLRLSPDAFWSMTVRELHRAVDGYANAHGMNRGPNYDELLAWAESEPDTPSIRKKPPAPAG